jgi:hypothetical protein
VSAPIVRWTRDGQTGMTESGYMIRLSSWGAYVVFDSKDRYCGRFQTREAAEAVVR